jgi:regulator of protease activity HflC (stomatin/prohibitin superfamily)
VVSVPIPLRYWMASSQELAAKVHTIIRTTIGQYDVHQAMTQGRSGLTSTRARSPLSNALAAP